MSREMNAAVFFVHEPGQSPEFLRGQNRFPARQKTGLLDFIGKREPEMTSSSGSTTTPRKPLLMPHPTVVCVRRPAPDRLPVYTETFFACS